MVEGSWQLHVSAIVVAIISLYIAWERSWVEYATTNQKTKKNPRNQKPNNQKQKGQGTKNPSHATHHVPQTLTTTPDEDITSHITDTLLETEQTCQVTLPENWHSSLLHHRTLGTQHPLPPHGTHVLHQIIYDYLILYTYIHCQDAWDLDIIVFCFLFFGYLVFGFLDFFGLLLRIVLNFSLKLCTTWWWPPLWPKHVVVSYLPPYSYI